MDWSCGSASERQSVPCSSTSLRAWAAVDSLCSLSHPSLHLRRVERQAARAEFLHLLDAQGGHGADTESLGDHPPDRDQLVALERHRQATVLGGHAFFQEQAHRRGTLQGDEGLAEQVAPTDPLLPGQRRAGRHHGDEAVAVERGELEVFQGLRLEGDAQLDAPVADHLQHLLVDHVVHRHVDPRVAFAKGLQDQRQQVAGEGGHGGDGDLAQLQGEVLAQQFLGIVPVGQQAQRQRQQGLALGGEADAAGGTFQQRTAEAFLQALDRQAQGRLGEVQAFAGLGEAEALRHGEEGAQLLDGHLFVFLINGLEKQT